MQGWIRVRVRAKVRVRVRAKVRVRRAAKWLPEVLSCMAQQPQAC